MTPSDRPVNPWLIAVVVALGAFMEVLDISIANVALPHMAGDLSASNSQASWVLTSYLVTNAIVMPITGWLANTFGRKRLYLTCIVGFTVSSLLCGLAPNLATLVALRAVQGASGGGLQPSAQAILSDTFPPTKRGMAMSLYGIAVVFAPAIGPTLGGWITDNFSWRWVFLINVPVGIVVFSLIAALVRDPKRMTEARGKARASGGISFDSIGFSLVALALGCLQIVLDRGQQDDWLNSPMISTLIAISACAFIAMIFWELRRQNPIIDLRLYRDRGFAVSNFLMLMLGFMLLGSTYLIPAFVQSLLGYTATDAGLVITPGGFVIMLMMPIVGRLSGRMDLRLMILCGFLITGLATYHMTSFYLGVDYTTIMLARAGQALGMAFLFIPINTLAFAEMSGAQTSNASGLINLARNLGGSIGISVVSTLVSRRERFHQTIITAHLTDYSPAARSFLHFTAQHFIAAGRPLLAARSALAALYRQVQLQAQLQGYLDVMKLFAVLFLALIPLLLLLKKGRVSDAGHAPAH
ncbi:MAG TPA: DHA2 family efflux MFS transporter permease subunit [Steroidobacteraceae bacterium]|nr:DHA2 family efflux MFS transporter permease subunit [Steroidobacteraceae bacterium]